MESIYRKLLAVVLFTILALSSFNIGSSALFYGGFEWSKLSDVNQAPQIRQFIDSSAKVISAQIATQNFKDQVPVESAVVVADMNSPLTVGYGADSEMIAASVYKLFVAALTYQDIEAGVVSRDDRLDKLNVGECIRLSIVISDNDCAELLAERIGWEEVDSRIAQNGFSNTSINNIGEDGEFVGDKVTTPRDVAKLLKSVYESDIISNESSNELLGYLESQEINDWLPDSSTLPQDLKILHKTGTLGTTVHEVGFFSKGTESYIFVVMTDGWPDNGYQESIEPIKSFINDITGVLFN